MDSLRKSLREGPVQGEEADDFNWSGEDNHCAAKPKESKVPKDKPIPESVTQSLIIAWLRTRGVFCFRVNTTGVWDENLKRHRVLNGIGALKGVSDILGVLKDGRFLAIEVKSSIGKLSPDQVEFLSKVNQSNGLGIMVRSLIEAKEKLNELV